MCYGRFKILQMLLHHKSIPLLQRWSNINEPGILEHIALKWDSYHECNAKTSNLLIHVVKISYRALPNCHATVAQMGAGWLSFQEHSARYRPISLFSARHNGRLHKDNICQAATASAAVAREWSKPVVNNGRPSVIMFALRPCKHIGLVCAVKLAGRHKQTKFMLIQWPCGCASSNHNDPRTHIGVWWMCGGDEGSRQI